jgi:hypothetical protein
MRSRASPLRELLQIHPVEFDLAGGRLTWRAHQAQDRAPGQRLAGAGFADDADPLAPDRE